MTVADPRGSADAGIQGDLRVSHTGGPGAWRGLIKRGREVVWRCDHTHPNRDEDAAHSAARPCARLVLGALVEPEKFQRTLEAMERAGCGVAGPLAAACARQFAWSLERRRWAIGEAGLLRARLAAAAVADPAAPAAAGGPAQVDWGRVLDLRCRAKRGLGVSAQEQALLEAAHLADPVRYGALDEDVFNATVPFGSSARWRS